jgi:hypothetical protein
MIIIWGSRMAGKCDHVPNLFYVRTQFFHVWWIPFIPYQSYIILHGSEVGSTFKGRATSFSFKSALFGWLRTGAVFGGVAGLVSLVLNGMVWIDKRDADHLAVALFSLAVLAGSVMVYWFCEHLAKASRHRAYQLGEELGIPPEYIDHVLDGTLPQEGTPPDVQPVEEPPQYGAPSASSEDRHEDDWRRN